MRDSFVAASGSMLVGLFVATAIVPGRPRCGMTGVDRDHMLIDMRLMQMVQVTVVEVVGVSLMLNRSVPATGTVLVRMAVVSVT
jgi:hypothetical protein